MRNALKTLALTAVLASATFITPASAEVPESASWQLAFVDADGKPTDFRMAHDVVGFVRGPRSFVLELICNQRDQMAFRMARRGTGRTQFTGESFEPRFIVRRGGKMLIDQEFNRAFDFRPAEDAYQGPVRKRLMNALEDGGTLTVREPGKPLNVTFTLRGSRAVINALPCSIDD